MYVSGTGSLDLLCTRHDRPSKIPDTPSNPLPNPDRRGNASFVDGHAEYVSRTYAHYYGHVWPSADH
jgi:prepilin-type processing-associated H-X9-DG protein